MVNQLVEDVGGIGIRHKPVSDRDIQEIVDALNALVGEKRTVIDQLLDLTFLKAGEAVSGFSAEILQGIMGAESDIRRNLGRTFTEADARRLITEVTNLAVRTAGESGTPLSFADEQQIRVIIQDNLFNTARSLADPAFQRQNLSDLPVAQRFAHEAILDREFDIRVLPTHPLFGQRLDAALQAMNDVPVAEGGISDEVYNAIISGASTDSDTAAIAVRMLDDIKRQMPQITQEAINGRGAFLGDFSFAVRSALDDVTPQQRAAGQSPFPTQVSPQQLRATRLSDTEIDLLATDPSKFLSERLLDAGIRKDLHADEASKAAITQFQAQLDTDLRDQQRDLAKAGAGPEVIAAALERIIDQRIAEFPEVLRAAQEAAAETVAREESFEKISDGPSALKAVNDHLQYELGVDPESISKEQRIQMARRLRGNFEIAKDRGEAAPSIDEALRGFFEQVPEFQAQLAAEEAALAAEEAAEEAVTDRETLLGSASALRQRVTAALVAAGILGINVSPEFREHIEQNVIPQMVADLTLAAEEEGPESDIDEIIRGLIQRSPAIDTSETDFARQFGEFPPGVLPSMIRQPLPPIEAEDILPQLREAAGESPGFLNFLQDPSVIQELQQGFQQARLPQVDLAALQTRQQGYRDRLKEHKAELARLQFGDPQEHALAPGVQRSITNIERILDEGPGSLGGFDVSKSLTPGVTMPGQALPEFFQGQLSGLRRRFEETPTGIAERARNEASTQQEASRAAAQAEQDRRRKLRRGQVVRV